MYEVDGWEVPEGFNFTRDVVEHLATDPGRPALTFVDADGVIERHTFAQVAADAARWAHVLRGSGYQPGDRVLVPTGTTPDWVTVMLGAIKGGLVTVPCPATLRAPELASRARHTGASLLIAERSAQSEVDAMQRVLDTEIDILFLDEAASLLRRCRPVAPTEATAADQYPFILYTPGTANAPKGVTHTHASTYATRAPAKHWLDLRPGDIVWCTAGTGWGQSIWNVLLGPWSHGAEVVMHAGGLDARERLDLLEVLGVSVLCQTPAEYRLMADLDDLSALRPSRLRHAVSAGEPLSADVIVRFHDAMSITVYDGYGQTESGLLVASTSSHTAQPGSLGFATPGHRVAVIDEQGDEVPPGEVGDIALFGRPPTLFDHYWDAPEETNSVVRGEWYVTGDRARCDEDGSFWFAGRSEDLIVSAAHPIVPFEVESVLLQHPAVAESAVVGKPDTDRGQVAKAFVVPHHGYEPTNELGAELEEHAKRLAAPGMHPHEIEFVTELPKTESGKIRRVELRTLELERAGIAEPPLAVAEPVPLAAEDARRSEAARGRAAERGRRAAEKEAKRAAQERLRAEADERHRQQQAQRQAEKEARRAEKEAKQAEQARLRAEAKEHREQEAAERQAEKEAKQAEQARLQAEAKEHREQEAAQRQAEKEAKQAEQARLQAEADEQRRQQEALRQAEQEAQRQAEQEAKQAEQARLQAEADEQRRGQQEAQRQAEKEAKQAEQARLQAEADEQRRQQEAQRQAEQEATLAEHAAQQRARAQATESRQQRKARRRAEKEAEQAERARVRAEAEEQRREEEALRQAEIEARRREELRLRAEAKEQARLEEAQRRADEDARRAEESRLRAEAKERARLEEVQRRADEEARQAEKQRLRAEEEQRRRSEEEERIAETERLRAEQERLRVEAEDARRAEAKERRESEETAKRVLAEQERRRREEQRLAEEAAAAGARKEAERRRQVEAARKKLEKAERRRRSAKPNAPKAAPPRSKPDEDEVDLGATLVERLEAYGVHVGDGPSDDA